MGRFYHRLNLICAILRSDSILLGCDCESDVRTPRCFRGWLVGIINVLAGSGPIFFRGGENGKTQLPRGKTPGFGPIKGM